MKRLRADLLAPPKRRTHAEYLAETGGLHTLLPTQMLPPQHAHGLSERKLAAALLEGACEDLRKYATVEGVAHRLYEDAARWVHGAEAKYTFAWVCAALDLDESYVRRKALEPGPKPKLPQRHLLYNDTLAYHGRHRRGTEEVA